MLGDFEELWLYAESVTLIVLVTRHSVASGYVLRQARKIQIDSHLDEGLFFYSRCEIALETSVLPCLPARCSCVAPRPGQTNGHLEPPRWVRLWLAAPRTTLWLAPSNCDTCHQLVAGSGALRMEECPSQWLCCFDWPLPSSKIAARHHGHLLVASDRHHC